MESQVYATKELEANAPHTHDDIGATMMLPPQRSTMFSDYSDSCASAEQEL